MATQLRRKHIAFIDAYTTPKQPGYLNSSESARLSGYAVKNPKNAGAIGNQLMKRPEIATRINEIIEGQRQVRLAGAEISREELTSLTKECLDEVPATHANKPRYIELIAKLRGFMADLVQNNLMVYNGADPEVRSSVDAKLAHFSRQLSRRPSPPAIESKPSKE